MRHWVASMTAQMERELVDEADGDDGGGFEEEEEDG